MVRTHNSYLTDKIQIALQKTAEYKVSAVEERVAGIEPAYCAWEAHVLPLNYTRMQRCWNL